MRAYSVLAALRQVYQVDILVCPPSNHPRTFLRRLLYRISQKAYYRWVQAPAEARFYPAKLPQPYLRWERVHLHRLLLWPLLRNWDWTNLRLQIDIDDLEPEKYREFALLSNRKELEFLMNAEIYAGLERDCLEVAAEAFVCSEQDRTTLQSRTDTLVKVLPNIPPQVEPLISNTAEPFRRLLFLGNLDYFPNSQGLLWFLQHTWPVLEGSGMTLEIAGSGTATPILKKLCNNLAGVRLHGFVTDTRPLYERCQAVVIPLFAGGGTRIKVLEAAAYRRLVISTPTGVANLGMKNDVHYLKAETPQEFLAALALAACPERRLRLVHNAFKFVESNFCQANLVSVLQPV